jgi:hypothetical protein
VWSPRTELCYGRRRCLVKEFSINREVFSRIAAKYDLLQFSRRKIEAVHGRYGNRGCKFERKCKRSRTDRGKGNGFELVLYREFKTPSVACREQFALAAGAIPPNRPNGVNNVSRRKTITAGDLGITCPTPAKCPTRFQKLGAGGMVNRTVYTAAAEKCGVCGVYNRVDVECRNVGFDSSECGHTRGHGRMRFEISWLR